jgi:hypothetical protein
VKEVPIEGQAVGEALCWPAPRNERDWLALARHGCEKLGGDALPSLASMASRSRCTNGEDGIEQEHTSVGPGAKVTMVGGGDTQV